jgi:hypothetical protein
LAGGIDGLSGNPQARVHCLTLFSFGNDQAAETAKTPRSHARW